MTYDHQTESAPCKNIPLPFRVDILGRCDYIFMTNVVRKFNRPVHITNYDFNR